MSVIEIQTFQLADGVDPAVFVEADARAQTEVAYRQSGLVRRTTAKGDDGEWLVVTLWASNEQADAATSALAGLSAFVDRATLRTARYRPLD